MVLSDMDEFLEDQFGLKQSKFVLVRLRIVKFRRCRRRLVNPFQSELFSDSKEVKSHLASI